MPMSRLQRELKQRKPFVSVGHEASVALLRTADLVRRHVAKTLAPYGITPAQYNVLRILRGAGADGLSINEVAERLIEQNPGITRMVDRLEARDWVRRERQTDDRRCVRCHLTTTGKRLVNRLDGPVGQADEDVVKGLSRTNCEKLIHFLDQIREQLG